MFDNDFFVGYGRLLHALAAPDGLLQDFEKEVVLEQIEEALLPALKPRMPTKLVLTPALLFACETDGTVTDDPALAFAQLIVLMREWKRKPPREAIKKMVEVLEFQARAYRTLTPEVRQLLTKMKRM
ncbi:MAG: hypothetical protein AAF570_25330 [Bacteroidota bacterium]